MTGLDWSAFGLNLVAAAGASLAVLLAAFGLALLRGVHRIVDVAWGIAFTVVVAVSYTMSAGDGGHGARRLLLVLLTAVWGLRLSRHLAWRARGKGEDPRYEGLPAKAPGRPAAYAFRRVYLRQAALVWFISLPVQAGQYVDAPLGTVAVFGVLVWAVGLFFESVGDRQLARFTADPANRGRIMDRGLWSWTRHPNYFGDCCVWWGLYLVAAGSWTVAALTLAAPLVMSRLLIAGSGKARLERRMADRPGWPAYAARTSGFFPRPPQRH